ncbi:MAG: hypothetical protein MR407_07060 [Roseburia sp.]|nr:hypothetical protein [Roseburia sp.]
MISPILIAMIILICVFLDRVSDRFGIPVLLMDFSLLTTSGVSQKRNEAVGNTKPPAMRVEDKLLYKKITFPL